MADLTVLYLTASLLPEKFCKEQREALTKAAKGYPIITVSREPLSFGEYTLIDDEEKHIVNIYRQMYRAAKLCKTKFIAVAEDDTFYHESHFNFYRPELDRFAYNQNRFALFTWGPPIYSWRNRKSNATLIAPTELMVHALEERFSKKPKNSDWLPQYSGELGREKCERGLGVQVQKSIEVYSDVSVIQFNHKFATEARQRIKRKSYGPIRAYDLFYWGRAREMVKKYEI